MFNFLKNKLKEWIKPKKVIELKPKKIKLKSEKKQKAEKIKHKKRTKQELEEERKIGEVIIEDIKNENIGKEIKPIPRQDEIIDGLKEKHEQSFGKVSQERWITSKQEAEKKSFWERIGLSRRYKITESDFSELFLELEMILLENNVALGVIDYLKESLQKELVDKEVKKEQVEETIKIALKKSLENLFVPGFSLLEKIKNKEGTFVIVFFGVNGSGKTTSIAKLAFLLKEKGFSVVLAAADTFRAASIEQLVRHGEKLGIKVIKQNYEADPAAVAYDAIEYAKAHKIKVVLVDTAGRMHTKENLIQEMGKIVRVAKPDSKIFVAEAITGNDAIEQAKVFNEAVGIDGIILSKQDVDEKGGTSLSVSYITKKPILYLGIGQKYSDLEEFNREKIISQLGL